MSEARRGDLWTLDFGDPVGREQGWIRPALVISSDHWDARAEILTVLPLTRTKHELPTRIEIEPGRRNGLDETSYARCEDIRSVSQRRFLHRLGHVDDVVLFAIARTIRTFWRSRTRPPGRRGEVPPLSGCLAASGARRDRAPFAIHRVDGRGSAAKWCCRPRLR